MDGTGSRRLGEDERLDRLRLARADQVGPVTFLRLLDRFGSAGAALAELPGLATPGRPSRIPSREDAAREHAAAERLGARLIAFGERDYPAPLAATADPPPVLTVLGDPRLLHGPCVAMVGARNASVAGQRFAERMAADLGGHGFVVVSGLARGIDSAAHAGSLETGTVAVVAGGVDVVFPPENAALYRRIAEKGAVVAELPLGTEPKARHFPRRNRVIAGLSAGVVVVEAALRSGSLLTARMAFDENREVFAVPGSPLDPRCRGANDLLRRRTAHLAEHAEDVVEVLRGQLDLRPPTRRRPPGHQPGPPAGRSTTPRHAPPDPRAPSAASADPGVDEAARVVEALGPTPVTVDELVRRCQLSAASVTSVLLELELAGRLERHPGQRVSLL
ncbi:MAG: DNA-processing protein DprA [Alphaproteobacteria bacterium]